MWRKLSPDEVLAFIKWARKSYVPGTPINPTWHPVVRDTCAQMTTEADAIAAVTDERGERRPRNAD